MTESIVVDVGTHTIRVALMLALPLLLVSLVTGLVISLFQVATSIQDVTLTFVPKMLAVGLALILAAHWMLQYLTGFARDLLADLSRVVG